MNSEMLEILSLPLEVIKNTKPLYFVISSDEWNRDENRSTIFDLCPYCDDKLSMSYKLNCLSFNCWRCNKYFKIIHTRYYVIVEECEF